MIYEFCSFYFFTNFVASFYNEIRLTNILIIQTWTQVLQVL